MSGKPMRLAAQLTPERRFVISLISDNPDGAMAALEHIEDINYRDSKGISLLDHALESGSDDVIGALLERGVAVSPEQAFIIYLLTGHPNEAIAHLEFIEDINHRNAKGKTLINYAIKSGHPSVVRAVAERGADLNAPDATGMTPLQLVLSYKADEEQQGQLLQIIQILLDKGADPLRPDAKGMTPIDFLMSFTNAEEGDEYIEHVTRLFELYGQQLLERERVAAERTAKARAFYPRGIKHKTNGGSRKLKTRRALKKRNRTRR